MILTTGQLDKILRDRCDKAQRRIWVCSPFIGGLKDVHHILGGAWEKPSVELRVLTDADAGFVLGDTFGAFSRCGEVRSLLSLHAKMYLVDDWCLLTSANLTGTAFCRRYECGTELVGKEMLSAEKVFENWWKMAKRVAALPKGKVAASLEAYQMGTAFKKICQLPPYSAQHAKTDNFLRNCDIYLDFAHLYKQVTGRFKPAKDLGFTLLQEIDYFLNFLYYEHPLTPSKGCMQPRPLSKAQQRQEIARYFGELTDDGSLENRLQRSRTVRKLLDTSHIQSLTRDEAKQVCHQLHCLDSYAIIRAKFLNPSNNSLHNIRKYWNELLHSGPITGLTIEHVKAQLRYCGPSFIQELIAWYYPEDYPMINKNSMCGMRFLGYDVR